MVQVLSTAVHNHYQRILNADQLAVARREREEGGRPEELKTGSRGFDGESTGEVQQPAAVPYPVSEETRKLMEDRSPFVHNALSETRCGSVL